MEQGRCWGQEDTGLLRGHLALLSGVQAQGHLYPGLASNQRTHTSGLSALHLARGTQRPLPLAGARLVKAKPRPATAFWHGHLFPAPAQLTASPQPPEAQHHNRV